MTSQSLVGPSAGSGPRGVSVTVEAVTANAMQTPDGAWRVEVVRRGHTRWYRLVHGDNQLDWLTIAAVQRLLSEAGIDLADLIEVTDQPPGPADNASPGLA